MKKTIVFLSMLLFATCVYCQKLDENKVDEFTKDTIKRTSWETLKTDLTGSTYFRISKINKLRLFEIRIIDNISCIVPGGASMMLKFNNDSMSDIKSIETAVSCIGCGAIGFGGSAAEGISVKYIIDEQSFINLKTYKILKIRIYFSDGYRELEIKDKNAAKVQNAANLI